MSYDVERMRTNYRLLEAYGPGLLEADQQWLEQKILEVIAEMLDHWLASQQQPRKNPDPDQHRS